MARGRRRRLTRREADERIEQLRRQRVPSRTERENLDQPVEPDLQVTGEFPARKLTLVIEGEEVASLWVIEFAQQIGSAAVRMGGIGGVGTRAEHRFQGHMRRVFEGALRWMRGEGFETSTLYGIPSFYPKFGYAQILPGVRFTLTVRDAEQVSSPAGYRLVKFKPKEHLRAVLRMYRANNAGRTGPTRRDPRHWEPFRKGASYGRKAIAKVALDAGGRPAGYVVLDSEPLSATIIEAGFEKREVFRALLHAAVRRAVGRRLEKLVLLVPEDDALAEWCQPLGLRKEVTWRPDGGGMGRMIHIPRALASVAAELGSRMRGEGCLTVRTNLDDVGLEWADGRLTVGPPHRRGPRARMPQWALAQLLYGYRSAAALAADGTLRASRKAVDALAEMFPVRPHYQHLVDHF
jgi:predicted acetyltransferase